MQLMPEDDAQLREALEKQYCQRWRASLEGQMVALGDAIRECGRTIVTECRRTWFARKIILPILDRLEARFH